MWPGSLWSLGACHRPQGGPDNDDLVRKRSVLLSHDFSDGLKTPQPFLKMVEKTLAVHPIFTSNGPNLWSYACLNTHANSTTRLSVPCHSEGLNRAWAEVSDAWRTDVFRPAARVWSQVVLTKTGACELHPFILTRLSRGRTHFKSICYERLLLRPQLKAEMKRLRHVIDDPPLGRTSLARTINCRGRGSNSCWRVLFWSFITRTEQERWLGSHKHATGEIWVRVCTRNVLSHSRSKKQMIMSYFTHPRLCFRWLY